MLFPKTVFPTNRSIIHPNHQNQWHKYYPEEEQQTEIGDKKDLCRLAPQMIASSQNFLGNEVLKHQVKWLNQRSPDWENSSNFLLGPSYKRNLHQGCSQELFLHHPWSEPNGSNWTQVEHTLKHTGCNTSACPDNVSRLNNPVHWLMGTVDSEQGGAFRFVFSVLHLRSLDPGKSPMISIFVKAIIIKHGN